MTLEEFKNTKFGSGLQVEYNGKSYDIESVDLQEGLIAIQECPDQEDADLSWKRCENCQLIKPEAVNIPIVEGAKIEYKKEGAHSWAALYNGSVIATLMVQNSDNHYSCAEGESKVYATDCTQIPSQLIPGHPFESMNKAKAVLEYHFRYLIES